MLCKKSSSASQPACMSICELRIGSPYLFDVSPIKLSHSSTTSNRIRRVTYLFWSTKGVKCGFQVQEIGTPKLNFDLLICCFQDYLGS